MHIYPVLFGDFIRLLVAVDYKARIVLTSFFGIVLLL